MTQEVLALPAHAVSDNRRVGLFWYVALNYSGSRYGVECELRDYGLVCNWVDAAVEDGGGPLRLEDSMEDSMSVLGERMDIKVLVPCRRHPR